MLVLTRKIGESIQIGDQVIVEVLEVRGGRARLGITAPSSIGVQRSEIVVPVSPEPPRRSVTPPLQPALQRSRMLRRVTELQTH